MKDRLRVNEWGYIHLKPQDLLRDAYWINRAWMLDLEWSTQAVLVMTSLIFTPLWRGCRAFYPRPQITTLESNKSCGCVCVCVRRSVFVCPAPLVSVCVLNSLSFKYHFSERRESSESEDVYTVCGFCLPGECLIGVSALFHPVAEFWREVCDVSHCSGIA